MPRLFKELRKLMYAEGIDQKYLSRQLGKCPSYVSTRMRGVLPWDMSDVYALCDLFDIAPDQIAVYFPRGDVRSRIPAD